MKNSDIFDGIIMVIIIVIMSSCATPIIFDKSLSLRDRRLAGLAALIPPHILIKTHISFDGVYNIYVYDTENKEIKIPNTGYVKKVFKNN